MAMPAAAHFQTLIPSVPIVTQNTGVKLTLEMRFTHPMAGGPLMSMGRPRRVGVIAPGTGRHDLTDGIRSGDASGKETFIAEYAVRRPGDHIFFLEPAAYWEPEEGVMIKHYTKVVVNAFGLERGWDRSVGFPVEIKPLTRPYGLWTGNVFSGVVIREGQPVPYATVEVEWRNDGSVEPPSSPYLTQVIRSDSNGVFTYALPRNGWWGFAALLDGEDAVPNPKGEMVPLEQGALIWVHARDME
jgi:cobalt/nickel transport protein